MTREQIDRLDETVRNLEKVSCSAFESSVVANFINSQKAKRPAQAVKAPPTPEVPKPADLGRPALSSDDLQLLLEDLSSPNEVEVPVAEEVEVKEPPVAPKVEKAPVKEPREAPVKKVRLPSSWVQVKANSIANKEKPRPVITSPGFSPALAGQSLLKLPFRIPKINKNSSLSPSSSRSSMSPCNSSNDSSVKKQESLLKLQPIDIFSPVNTKKEQSKLFQPMRWDEIPPSNKKLKLEVNAEQQPLEKIKIVRSPSVDKHGVFTIKKSPEDAVDNTVNTSPMPRIRVRDPEEMLAAMEQTPQRQETKEAPQVLSESRLQLRRTKELKRLHENIVKDASPLSKRRSCTIKPIDDSLVNTDEDQEQPVAKRVRSDPPQPKLDVAERNLRKPKSPAKVVTPARKAEKASDVKQPQQTTRTTRKSMQAAVEEKVEQKVEKPAKTLRTYPKSSAMSKMMQGHDLKPCSINLPAVTTDELKKMPASPSRSQIAKKSTSQRPNLKQFLNRSLLLNNRKFKKKIPTRTVKPDDTNDDEWEDLEVCSTTSNDPSEDSNVEASSVESGPKPITTLVSKNICNISFTKCRSGAIYKCAVNGCRFHTLQDHSFVKHLDTRHRDVTWNGYCNLCLKTVLPTKIGHLLFNEFLHMMSCHMQVEQSEEEVVLAVEHNPEPPRQPSAPDVNLELMKGIDAILGELLPSDSDAGAEKAKESPPMKEVKAPSSLPKAATTIPNNNKVVISKNIVGRIIPLSQIPGIKLTMSPSVLENMKKGQINFKKPVAVKAPMEAPVESPTGQKIVKYVIQKPKDDNSQVAVVQKPAEIMQAPIIKPPKQQLFAPLIAQSNISNVTVDKAPPTESNSDSIFLRYHEALRPWLSKKTKKSLQAANQMMSPYALTANYKCLGASCCFYTSDVNLFLKHLMFHLKFTLTDKKNFMSCAYCAYECGGSPEDLVGHIRKEHAYDNFQCNYCFYRSCVDFNVMTHQNNFHKMKPRTILQLEPKEVRNYSEELEIVRRKRGDFVPPIICVCKFSI